MGAATVIVGTFGFLASLRRSWGVLSNLFWFNFSFCRRTQSAKLEPGHMQGTIIQRNTGISTRTSSVNRTTTIAIILLDCGCRTGVVT